MKVLAGDIGGTKTLLALMAVEPGHCRVLRQARYASGRYPDFESLLHQFLAEAGEEAVRHLEAACIAVAGPVREGKAQVTNLPWRLDAQVLADILGTPRVCLLNDFAAVGHGIEALGEEDTALLQAGRPEARGNRAVIGAGTGLGQAILVWQGGGYTVLPTEGGHADFAPTDELQAALWEDLRRRLGRVSYEHVLSGPGLERIFRFLCRHRDAEPRPELAAALSGGDAPAAVAQAGLAGSDPLAQEALGLFVSVYGAQAGNLALAALATGGLYVAGGIAPKILPALRGEAFLRAFRAKAPMEDLMAAVPVRVVTDPQVGLRGAALVAARL